MTTQSNDDRVITAVDLVQVLQRLGIILGWSPLDMREVIRQALAARDAAQRADGDTNGTGGDR